MNHTNDKPAKWEKFALKVKEIDGNVNLSDEQAEKVIDFLKMLAELEIKMREEGLLKE